MWWWRGARRLLSSYPLHTLKGEALDQPGALQYARNIVFFGPPGVGKGTYASMLAEQLGIIHLAVGDLVRGEIKAGTELGQRMKADAERGALVGDDIVMALVDKALQKPEFHQGYILDGVPRTLWQAQELDKITKVDLVVNLFQRRDILVAKLDGRRMCSSCGKNYNLADIKENDFHLPPLLPEVPGVCDRCGAKDSLIQRKDDKADVVRYRLEVYEESSAPLIDYFAKQDKLINFHVLKGAKELSPVLAKAFLGSQ